MTQMLPGCVEGSKYHLDSMRSRSGLLLKASVCAPWFLAAAFDARPSAGRGRRSSSGLFAGAAASLTDRAAATWREAGLAEPAVAGWEGVTRASPAASRPQPLSGSYTVNYGTAERTSAEVKRPATAVNVDLRRARLVVG